jgi:hypothetical protein
LIPAVQQSVLAMVLTLAVSAVSGAEIDFAHDIVPVLRQHCGECHTGAKKQGGFSMNTRDLLVAGGESGRAVQVGKSARSQLITRIKSKDPDLQMPPEGDRVPANLIEKLECWLDEGLKWEPGFSFAETGYEPPLKPRRPDLPQAREGRTNPVDRFVDSYFGKHQAARPVRASDATFIRRVYADVIGLLPSPDELQSFLDDPRANKREELGPRSIGISLMQSIG